jgi:hypothetical protein
MRTLALAIPLALAAGSAAADPGIDPPFAPAGAPAAPLPPDDAAAAWRLSLSTGLAGRAGGMRLDPSRENPGLLLAFAGEADGSWPRSFGQGVRVRFRLFTGGETDLWVPSDGDVEGAWTIGRRELRFVLARIEVARAPAVGLETLAQLATLPSLEGTVGLVGELIRISYAIAPVEASFVRYHGAWHLPGGPGWPSESDGVVPATAARLRYAVRVSPAVAFSAQGDLVKLWRRGDLALAGEASLGTQALDRTALLSLSLRWEGYARRGIARDTTDAASEVLLVAGATLAF